MPPLYDLNFKPRRAQGLTAVDYKGPSLLLNINHLISRNSSTSEMPSRASGRLVQKAPSTVRVNDFAKEDRPIDAPPESSSDEDNGADIKPTIFASRSKSPTPDIRGSKVGGGGNKNKNGTVNGTRPSRTEQAKKSPSSSSGSSPTKRKTPAIQEDRFKGNGVVDPFGRAVKQKKARIGYGSSSQPRSASNQPASLPKKAASSPQGLLLFMILGSRSYISTAARFQKFNLQFDFQSSPINSQDVKSPPGKKVLLKPDELGSSPGNPNTPTRSFAAPPVFENSPTSTPGVDRGFKAPRYGESTSLLDIKGGESFTDPGTLEDTVASTPPFLKELVQISANSAPFKRDPKKILELNKYNLGGDLAARVKNIVGRDGINLGADSRGASDDEFDISMTVEGRCPMCNQPCDGSELKKWGTMNTRQQEKFCRSHRKTNAEKRWNSKGYPEIDWEKLDSRILQHHDFIKRLLNGADCHYRHAFDELVAAGKGRSLRKMEANLIPGYYGSRGLNTISDHVIGAFSELLSEMSVDDELISKRGTTTFVQSVIVPEVAVQLIMEDMSIDEVEARDVLAESSNVGEIVNEEIRDVVLERVENSDDDSGNDG
jgi:hypothetical protein